MFVRACIAVLVVITGVILALAFVRDDGQLALYAVPSAVLLAGALAFKPQLDWAYYKRFPADLDEPLRRLFEARYPGWYQAMSGEERLAFRQNTALVRLGIDFKGQGFDGESVPEDIAVVLASQLTRLLPEGQHVLRPFETVVVYQHAFPSPQFPEHWHHSELFEEDGVLLFDSEAALSGILEPATHFNIALYEWVRAAAIVGVRSVRDGAEGIAEARREWVTEAVGLPEEAIDWRAVAYALTLDGVHA